jgi:hypothetical protein
MLVIVVACLLCALCMLMSVRHMWRVWHALDSDLTVLTAILLRDGMAAVFPVLQGARSGSFEAEVYAALCVHTEHGADVEQLLGEPAAEVEFALARSARVPLMCARIASTTGFLSASLRMRAGLVDDYATDAATLEIIQSGVDMVAVGLATALCCVAVQRTAATLARETQRAVDLFVDALLAVKAP